MHNSQMSLEAKLHRDACMDQSSPDYNVNVLDCRWDGPRRRLSSERPGDWGRRRFSAKWVCGVAGETRTITKSFKLGSLVKVLV